MYPHQEARNTTAAAAEPSPPSEMPDLGATDPADLEAKARAELGFSRQLDQPRQIASHPVLGGTGYPVWYHEQRLEKWNAEYLKKIRIDGSTAGVNQRTVFDDDGDVKEDTIHIGEGGGGSAMAGEDVAVMTTSATTGAIFSDATVLASVREEYLQKVRSRLKETRELDRREEKERIQDKHKKRNVKERSGEGDAVGRIEEVGDEERWRRCGRAGLFLPQQGR
jgi:hypothetical protein